MTHRGSWLVAALALLAMGWGLGNAVVYDAAAILQHDSRFALPIDWTGLVTDPWWRQGLWRPLTMLLLGVEVRLAGGVAPGLLHLVSLLLYLVTVLLLWRAARGLADASTAALVAVALFAVHPVHVEVVASVVGQAELLLAIAMLAALVVWHRAAMRGPRAADLALLALIQVAAATAKEQGFLLPVVLLGQHLLLTPRVPTRVAGRWLAILALVAATLWALHWEVTGSPAGEVPARHLAALDPVGRVATALAVLPRIVMLLVLPVRLQAEYGPPALRVDGVFGIEAWLGGLILVVLVAAFLLARTRRPVAAFGLWWAAVMWLPVSSLVVPAGLMLAERVLFLPTVGLAIAIAGCWRGAPRLGALVVVAVLVAGGLVRSALRFGAWENPERFAVALTDDAPRTYRAWYVRGVLEREAGQFGDAEASLRRAIDLWPREPVVYEELGQLLRYQDRCDDAIPVLRDGLALEPTRTALRAKLAECLLSTGDSTAARAIAADGLALGDEAFRDLWRRAGGAPPERN